MVSIEIAALVLTGLGLTASIIYYSIILSNANKTQQMQLETRQAQLLTQIYNTLYTENAWKNYLEAQYESKFTNYEEFQEKYGRGNPEFYSKILSVWWSYNTVGGLLDQGLVNVESVNQLMGTMIVNQWEKWGDVIRELRVDINSSDAFIDFEYLYYRIKELRTSGSEAERIKSVLNMAPKLQ